MAWGPQPHQISSLALVRGGGPLAAKLLARLWYIGPGTFAGTVPDGAKWLSVRIGAAGGDASNGGDTPGAGGGGAFSREDRTCVAGQATSVFSQASGSGIVLTTFTLAGLIICAADSGKSFSEGGGGGAAAAGTGTIRRSGGASGSAGQDGGDAGTSGNTNAGGGSAGERSAIDCLIPGARGGKNAGNSSPDGYGGGAGRSGFAGVSTSGGLPIVVVEYWSAKP